MGTPNISAKEETRFLPSTKVHQGYVGVEEVALLGENKPTSVDSSSNFFQGRLGKAIAASVAVGVLLVGAKSMQGDPSLVVPKPTGIVEDPLLEVPISATEGDYVKGRCGPLFSGRRCDCSGWEIYCNTDNGWCGETDAHKDAQAGDQYDCRPSGRCGPLFGDRSCDCSGWEIYCNTDNGWCGDTDAHKNAQAGDEYDCKP